MSSGADARAGVALASGRGRGILAATVGGSAMVFLDTSVVSVALPTIGRDLHADLGTLQWTVNAYTLALASLILLGGSLGDRLGLARVFTVGVVWFAAASVLCAVSPTADVLVLARALQGVGGALLTPMSLALLESVLAPQDRARAIGAWSGATTLAVIGAPLIGGALVALSWRWVFAINVPVAAATVLLAVRYLPRGRTEAPGPTSPTSPATQATPAGQVRQVRSGGRTRWAAVLDLPGALLGAATLGALTWALISAASVGASAAVVAASLVAAAAAVGFVLRERRAAAPVVPLALFRDRTFSATNAFTLLVYAALSGFGLLTSLQLQVSLGYSPLEAGAATLPAPILLGVLSSRAAALGQRLGPRVMLTSGACLAAAGFAYLAQAGPGDGYLGAVMPGVVAFGAGAVMFVAPLTATVLAAAPTHLAGAASGVNNAVARTAGLVAVAALPAVVGLHGLAYRDPTTLTHAYRTGMLLCAGLLALGALVAATAVPRRHPRLAPTAPAR